MNYTIIAMRYLQTTPPVPLDPAFGSAFYREI